MSAAPQRFTLSEVLALVAIWTAVIYGVAAKRPPDTDQVSLKKPSLAACARRG